MRGASQRERLSIVQELIAAPDDVAGRVAESIRLFEAYDNIHEEFCPWHPPLPAPLAVVNGRTMAAALQQSPHRVSSTPDFYLTVVDYEVPPARTTKRAERMLNQFADGRASTATMSIDLLLKRDDGAAVVGEVKVAKTNGYDTDSTLALIQALAAATQLSTVTQQARLARCYPSTWTAPMPIDIAVIAYHPSKLAAAAFQSALDCVAFELAETLVAAPTFPPQIRHIDFLRASGPPTALAIRVLVKSDVAIRAADS
jgi:hypothetical protein